MPRAIPASQAPKLLLDVYPDTLPAEFGRKASRNFRQAWIDARDACKKRNAQMVDINQCSERAASDANHLGERI